MVATEASIHNKLTLILPLIQKNHHDDTTPDVHELWKRVKLMRRVLTWKEIENVLQLIIDEINNPPAGCLEDWNSFTFTFNIIWDKLETGKNLTEYLVYHIFYDETFLQLKKHFDFHYSEFIYVLESILEFDIDRNLLLKRILSKKFLRLYLARHQLDKSTIKPIIFHSIEKYLNDRTTETASILSQFMRDYDAI